MSTADQLYQKATSFDHVRRAMCREMLELIEEGAYQDALAIADALIPIYDVELYGLCNALWVVQHDNTGLPLDEARARRYLAATLTRAPANPEMHLNAAAVWIELGDEEAAMRQLLLAKRHEVDLAPHLDAPLLAPLKSHARWPELVDGLKASVEDVTWIEIAEDCFARGCFDDAVPATLRRWRQTRSPGLADLLDAIAQATEVRSGYCAGRIEEAIAKDPAALVSTLDQGTLWRVAEETNEWLLYDLDDPRFSSALIPLLLSSPRQPAAKLVEMGWRALMKNVAAARDRRLIAPLRELSKHARRMVPGAIGETLNETFEAAAQRIEEAPAPESSLSADEAACLARLEAVIPRAADPFTVDIELPEVASAPSERDALLELWRKTRSPRVAELITLREMRSPSLELETRVRDLDPKLDLWDYDDPRLCGKDAAQLVWEKRHEGRDPRVVDQLLKLLIDPPFVYPRADNGVENFWVELMTTLRSFEDVRALEPLCAFEGRIHALCQEADEVADEEMYGASPLGGILQREVGIVIRHLRSVTVEALSEDDRLRVEALEVEYAAERRARDQALEAEAGSRARAQQLLRAVLEDVDADPARLAYAEHLAERGDPYGEFIRLQVKGEDPQRQAELLEAHRGRFVGPLANVVTSAVFERGFVTECEIDKYKLERADTTELPLQTIRCLHLDGGDWGRHVRASGELVPNRAFFELMAHPALASLRHLDGVTAEALPTLVEGGCPDVETLTFDISGNSEVDWSAPLAALGRLPRLRRVRASIDWPDYFASTLPLLQGELPETVEAIELVIGERDRIKDWAGIYDAWSSTRFSELVVCSPGLDVRLAREGPRVSVRAEQKTDQEA